jgi:Zn-dependent M32 family carboxypeptidase
MPGQLLEAVTGSKLKPHIFVDYLKAKYTDIYGL